MAFSAAPKMKSGDSIELTPLTGKVIAVRATNRYGVETKFGHRSISQVQMIVEGSPKPLDGVLFQTYFQGLDLNHWFVGRVVKVATSRGSSWGLESKGIDKKVLAKLETAINALPPDEVEGV